MKRIELVALAFFVGWATLCGAAPANPEWLDTLAPVLSVLPRQRYQSKVFHIELRANEQAVIKYRLGRAGDFFLYENPLTVTSEGETVIFYTAEDMFGNTAPLDSAVFVLDTRAPRFELDPPPGRYRQVISLKIKANEPCRYRFHLSPQDSTGFELQSGFRIRDSLVGYLTAIDSAGNTTTTGLLQYRIDTSRIVVAISPRPGVYNTLQRMALSASGRANLFFSFDPVAPPEWFVKYDKPVALPAGLTNVRYLARDGQGWQSAVQQATYVIDTVPPRPRIRHSQGKRVDTLEIVVREQSVIRYELGGRNPDVTSPVYSTPLVVEREGIVQLKAFARDSAGNESPIISFSFKYDSIPPRISLSPAGGTFTQPAVVTVKASEPCLFFYTVDGSEPSPRSTPSDGRIVISRQGETSLRVIGVDKAGNISKDVSGVFYVDSEPATVTTKIQGDLDNNEFLVVLEVEPGAQIYYEIGERIPTRGSAVYTAPLKLALGTTVRYFTVDRAGNVGEVQVMDELRRPMVTATPSAGVYNKRLRITFLTSVPSQVFYRMLPDTVFDLYKDTIALTLSGTYALEYYSQTAAGLKSPVRRETYTIDISPPSVSLTVKKGIGDTAFVLLEADENASIFYTTDGSNPFYSRTTRMVGNKLTQSRARISVRRSKDLKLAFYAEDAAGNQSALNVLDVFKPRAVPNIPAGPETLYDRILSVALSAFDQSVIYYARHGRTPTVDSSVYTAPLTLVKSDTLCVFVVDASGYMGKIDTFVYLIDLPPSPRLHVSPGPDSLRSGYPVRFDASGSIDAETPQAQLVYRWDFDGDGTFETGFSPTAIVSHTYAQPGLYRATVEVRDKGGRVAQAVEELRVRALCLPGMVYVVDKTGNHFCMDRYEWPNLAGRMPLAGVSWVEAKMYCLEAGKRLCTSSEWENACRGRAPLAYPYGSEYRKGLCASEGAGPFVAGSFGTCAEGFGLQDMVGNVWEWVEDKNGDFPLIMGGAWTSGAGAHCGQRTEATIGTKSAQIGFRCCK